MKTWQIRKVTGKGYLFDEAIAAYKDLTDDQADEMKRGYGIVYMGEMMDFINVEALLSSGKSPEGLSDEDLDALRTCWKGNPLPNGMQYCVFVEIDADGKETGTQAGAAAAIKKAFEMKIQDRVVMAEGNQRFSTGTSAEARKNVAQTERIEGGVWGVKRKSPPRV